MGRAGRTLTASLSLAVVLLSGCTGDGNGAISDTPTATEDVSTETIAPADITEGKDWGDRQTQGPRGTLIKEVGEWAGLRDDEGQALAVFRITQIEPGLGCTAPEAHEPVNGQFIGLHLEIETSAELGETGSRATFTLSPESFRVVDSSGRESGRLLGEAKECLVREQYLPDAIPAGRTATGIVVLDAPQDVASIILDGEAFRTHSGWEWKMPAAAG